MVEFEAANPAGRNYHGSLAQDDRGEGSRNEPARTDVARFAGLDQADDRWSCRQVRARGDEELLWLSMTYTFLHLDVSRMERWISFRRRPISHSIRQRA